MKHWGPLDLFRRDVDGDEHGFPSDLRDSIWREGALTAEARAAVEASRAYLEIAMRGNEPPELALASFLDEHVSR